MTPYESASLWTQWIGSISAALAVVVAIVFGYLTLASNQRSKDAQQRATLAAALAGSPHSSQTLLAGARPGTTRLSVRHKAGEAWLLVNDGPDTVYLVDIQGLTELDKKRLHETPRDPPTLAPGEAAEFSLVSRYTLSGPANVVVTYRLQPEGPPLQSVLQVPAP